MTTNQSDKTKTVLFFTETAEKMQDLQAKSMLYNYVFYNLRVKAASEFGDGDSSARREFLSFCEKLVNDGHATNVEVLLDLVNIYSGIDDELGFSASRYHDPLKALLYSSKALTHSKLYEGGCEDLQKNMQHLFCEAIDLVSHMHARVLRKLPKILTDKHYLQPELFLAEVFDGKIKELDVPRDPLKAQQYYTLAFANSGEAYLSKKEIDSRIGRLRSEVEQEKAPRSSFDSLGFQKAAFEKGDKREVPERK